jgi:hypothetical protein
VLEETDSPAQAKITRSRSTNGSHALEQRCDPLESGREVWRSGEAQGIVRCRAAELLPDEGLKVIAARGVGAGYVGGTG